jgi:hypothetical protein
VRLNETAIRFTETGHRAREGVAGHLKGFRFTPLARMSQSFGGFVN